jgi:hypothetical protein
MLIESLPIPDLHRIATPGDVADASARHLPQERFETAPRYGRIGSEWRSGVGSEA